VADGHGDDDLNKPARSGDDHRPDREGTKQSTRRPKLNNGYSAGGTSSSDAAMHSKRQAADLANGISRGSGNAPPRNTPGQWSSGAKASASTSSLGRPMATDARKTARAAVSSKAQRQRQKRPEQVGKEREGLTGGGGQSSKVPRRRPVAAGEVHDDPKNCVALIYRIFKDWDLKKTIYVIVILVALTACLVALTLVQGGWSGSAAKFGSYAKKGAIVTTALGFVGSIAGVIVKVKKKHD
jgi:hypothetical protein